jgi:hypothetical protein
LRSHVQVVLAHHELTTISELQAYHELLLPVPSGSQILKPLTDLLIGGHKVTEPVSPG